MTSRARTLSEFWPYYLSEHADPTTRALHFLGTSGFIAALITSFWLSTLPMVAAAIYSLIVLGIAIRFVEPYRAAFVPGALIIVALLVAAPTVMSFGILFAYVCAWVGHFNFEGNKPVTFRFPAWSMVCDLRLFGMMCAGQLWTGDLRQTSVESG